MKPEPSEVIASRRMEPISLVQPVGVTAATVGLAIVCGSGPIMAGIAGIVVFFWAWGRQIDIARRKGHSRPVSPQQLAEQGLGPLPANAAAKELYLDMVKRSLMNIIYHETSGTMWRYNSIERVPHLLPGMDLSSRVHGEDVATNTLTMIGAKRLDNIQHCVETVLAQDVPGDLIETGARKGGACIYMKAVLRANEPQNDGANRQVIVCDVFSPRKPAPSVIGWIISQPIFLLLALLASIPIQRWKRALFMVAQRKQSSFPTVDDPSDELINGAVFIVRNFWSLRRVDTTPICGTGEENVRSHFARLGLLDDRVVFLRGFFADTLPEAPIEQLALLRLDGDTYESTMDALRPLYPKLSPGGFCIVDDYHSFEECRRAVDEYREQHGIIAPITRIDDASVFWRNGDASEGASAAPPMSTAGKKAERQV